MNKIVVRKITVKTPIIELDSEFKLHSVEPIEIPTAIET
jgi:hypothetical protein